MMIEPPIDDMVKKINNNKYILCRVMAKRAKELEVEMPDEIAASDKKSISLAADEIISDEIAATPIDKD